MISYHDIPLGEETWRGEYPECIKYGELAGEACASRYPPSPLQYALNTRVHLTSPISILARYVLGANAPQNRNIQCTRTRCDNGKAFESYRAVRFKRLTVQCFLQCERHSVINFAPTSRKWAVTRTRSEILKRCNTLSPVRAAYPRAFLRPRDPRSSPRFSRERMKSTGPREREKDRERDVLSEWERVRCDEMVRPRAVYGREWWSRVERRSGCACVHTAGAYSRWIYRLGRRLGTIVSERHRLNSLGLFIHRFRCVLRSVPRPADQHWNSGKGAFDKTFKLTIKRYPGAQNLNKVFVHFVHRLRKVFNMNVLWPFT